MTIKEVEQVHVCVCVRVILFNLDLLVCYQWPVGFMQGR